MEGSNILPALFHEGDQKVDSHSDILPEFFLREGDGADGGSHAVDLLALELDGLLELSNFFDDFLSFNKVDGESLHFDKDVSEEFVDLLSNAI